MPRRLKPFHLLEGAQASASDPLVHAALSASAGTGKTHVLTSRVLRLLLRGTPPSSILCLTFTKAGAAEMANRIGERLAYWVRLPNAELRQELFSLGEENSPPAIESARRLFARVLEAPGGGLRIQTIHSFAQTLLAAFPAEAGISPGFRPIEGRAEAELARRTLAGLLAEAESGRDERLIADVSTLSLRLGEAGAESYLMECAHAHEAMEELGLPGMIEPRLYRLIGLETDEPDGEIAARLADEEIDVDLIDRLIAANRAWGAATGTKIVANLTAFLGGLPADRLGLLDGLASGIVTAKGEPCKITAKQEAAEPGYASLAAEFALWWSEIRTLRAAAALAKIQAAGLRAGQAFAHAYVRAKRAAGVADFDDLIHWTRRLFAQPGMGDWVRFKLDQRTDHILVDEAQDTNADQWAIVDALAAEYFTGNPEAEDRWRTLFMVGDYKQAIFGFQGTNPREYEAFRGRIADRAAALVDSADEAEVRTREFRDLSIDASFRSAPPVLEVVDALIDQVGHAAMGLAQPPNRHVPHHARRPGRVELWPAYDPGVAAADDAGEEGWIDEPVRLYADAVAQQVRRWLAEAPTMDSTGRALCAGDILILVRSRTELAALIVARLYAQGVPVAGIDRLHLHKPLAVKDLMAAVAFAVQPLDDLVVANLLVSPLIGWDQQQLYDLAQPRKGRLWTELQRRREEQAHYADAHSVLSAWLSQADYTTPARFLESILSGPLDGRSKLIRRLGEAARDPIDELVASALLFEAEEVASLDRFLAWFGQGDVEVKRDPSAPLNAVRVMTVHGAKGLEAPLVLLADATHDPAKVGGTLLTMEFDLTDVGKLPLIRPRKDECAPIFRVLIDAAKAADLEEHWRLAYVGLTRAAERLVIAGVKPKKDVPAGSWHSAGAQAMLSLGAGPEEIEGWGAALVWEGTEPVVPRRARAKDALYPIEIPPWLREQAPVEARPPRPLAPSQIVEDRDAVPPPGPAMRAAARRGTLLHALFERLPAVEPSSRRDLALNWLKRAGVETDAVQQEIADAALVVLHDPRFADLFGSEELAEAPIAATLADGRVIAGTVDRLCIGPDLIRVIDFKTGRAVPPDLAAVPDAHRRQMAAYVEALRVIFPDRRVEAALLYTSGPALIALPT
ncbi:MAG: double-strand break repair helicase AddA [Sphingomonas sp.]|uniref:double-strand break repair helicase AddA n=1 Tax=Sphingomonas sp. TaxID=28214 RepID=UPI0017E54816|nr:double-strand break repair helicase AddA [Sphingomonas sp.]MBA3666208.1 double-strand break repair helicase AddA [Sphingomonas sp.]